MLSTFRFSTCTTRDGSNTVEHTGFRFSSGPLPAQRGRKTPVPLDSLPDPPDPKNTALIPEPPPFAAVHFEVLL